VGRELISKVTDGVMDDLRAWAQRPLEDVYPVIFLDALVLKIREGGTVQRRACYLALGSRWTETAMCSACGFRRPRAPNSGYRSSQSSGTAASTTS
jgi:Transposase, Mutator family